MIGTPRSIGGLTVSNADTALEIGGAFDAMISLRDPRQPDDRGAGSVPKIRQLVLHVSDVCESVPGHTPATAEDVRHILRFAREVPDRLLVHCNHGISRSPAAAIAILSDRWGHGRESDVLGAVLALQPFAIPNRHIVALADAVLARAGALSSALAAWSATQPWAHELGDISLETTLEEMSMVESRSTLIAGGRNWIGARVSRLIPASVETVFHFLSDASNDTEWISSLSHSRRLDSGEVKVGSRFEQTAISPMGRATVVWRIRELEPQLRIVGESVAGNYRFFGGYEFEPRGNGTWVTKFASFERRGLLLAVPKMLGNSLMQNHFQSWLNVLAARDW